ncbi:uncharacterized protein LOC130895148 [Diorhabda carinulata]|uniref:uncharacterized protein LOC130895148 n=1 Tax=Diorhabda carinulata TaxID=1163345 RepID=UPI0025A08FDC|nr:uncharacterized protein LOC130895148 [Diorhabda carinulata]
MNKAFVFVLIGFLAIQTIECRPKAAAKNTANSVEEGEISKKTQEFIKKADEIISGTVPNSQQIISNIEQTGEKVASGIKELNAAITKKISENREPIDNFLQQLSTDLHTAHEKIQAQVLGPNGEKKAAELKDNLTQQLKDVAAKIDQFNSNIKPEADKIKNDVLGALNAFLTKAEEAATTLKKAVSDAKTK